MVVPRSPRYHNCFVWNAGHNLSPPATFEGALSRIYINRVAHICVWARKTHMTWPGKAGDTCGVTAAVGGTKMIVRVTLRRFPPFLLGLVVRTVVASESSVQKIRASRGPPAERAPSCRRPERR